MLTNVTTVASIQLQMAYDNGSDTSVFECVFLNMYAGYRAVGVCLKLCKNQHMQIQLFGQLFDSITVLLENQKVLINVLNYPDEERSYASYTVYSLIILLYHFTHEFPSSLKTMANQNVDLLMEKILDSGVHSWNLRTLCLDIYISIQSQQLHCPTINIQHWMEKNQQRANELAGNVNSISSEVSEMDLTPVHPEVDVRWIILDTIREQERHQGSKENQLYLGDPVDFPESPKNKSKSNKGRKSKLKKG